MVATASVTIKFSSNYVPYGSNYAMTGTEVFMYTGEPYNSVTGLYLIGARYYDPSIGRFVTEDSYSGDENDPMTLDRYIYGRDNPERYEDPSGHAYVISTGVVTNTESVCQADPAACYSISSTLTGGTSVKSVDLTLTEAGDNQYFYPTPASGPPDVVLARSGNVAASGEDLTFQQQMNLAGVSGTSFYGGVPGSGGPTSPSLPTVQPGNRISDAINIGNSLSGPPNPARSFINFIYQKFIFPVPHENPPLEGGEPPIDGGDLFPPFFGEIVL